MNDAKSHLSLFFSLLIYFSGHSQEKILHRVILVGEAANSSAMDAVIQHAASETIAGKTTVFFLDENAFLKGNVSPGSGREVAARKIVEKQFRPMRTARARVYFLPGNHTWNKEPVKTLEKLNRMARFVEEQADSLVKFVPANHCPDPFVIPLTDSTIILVFNSEWWLFPANNTNPENECECKSRVEVLARLDEIRYKNAGKQILFLSHHPFQSYGIHDGRFTWKDHLFPLTSFHKALYVPLPVAGSVMAFFRSAFASPNDTKHPLHKNMVENVDGIFADFPNLVHLAGHEQGLLLIRNGQVQLVSGHSATHLTAKKSKHTLFASNEPGYATLDVLPGQEILISFYQQKKRRIVRLFNHRIAFTPAMEDEFVRDTTGQIDSVVVRIHPAYDEPGKFHRFLFGENYRKEWALPVKLPLIRASVFEGGLRPTQRGGGMQSKSLRLEDRNQREWVIRSVEKSPDALLPGEFRQTFARDWVDDATSAQHPFSALVVPPIANAVNVPHAVPMMGVVAPDKKLGIYGRVFANMVALVEEREPLGGSDNTVKMKQKLKDDNDNRILATEFLNARMLDLLLGDWDRHEDQWRWKDISKGKGKSYVGIPRDRDQVFHVTQGLIPRFASRDYILPTLRDFDHKVEEVKWVLFKSKFVNAYPEFQLSREVWNRQAELFKKSITDSVIEAGLGRLPPPAYELRHAELFSKLRSRRDRIPEVMDRYYRFIQKIVDIRTSDKDEWVQINDSPNGGLHVRIHKISKKGEIEDELMNKIYDPGLTGEIRIYIGDGNDSIVLDNKYSGIKLRLIGGKDRKAYRFIEVNNTVKLYDKPNGSAFYGDLSRVIRSISDDSLHTAFVPVNLYNIRMPLTLAGLNIDDGVIIGAGIKYIRQEGFRKLPYSSAQQLTLGYSFSTGAYRIRYNGEWIGAFGKNDFVVQGFARAPNNTINFFGRGNETVYNKTGDFKRFYRTRFSTYELDPAIRWRLSQHASIHFGPSLYAYFFDADENTGRFINQVSRIGSYDSATVDKTKWHLGMTAGFTRDKRNNRIFPQWGSFINLRLQGYQGFGKLARSFGRMVTEFSFYKSLNKKSTIILADRVGGTLGIGHPAFYQSAFLGGHENLLGFRQFRFAGLHSFYNNLELRIRLADIAGYILPGQFGICGFWDFGRVWEKNDSSKKWHHGKGGGIYFAPASVVAISFVLGHSPEGFYPYFTVGLRF